MMSSPSYLCHQQSTVADHLTDGVACETAFPIPILHRRYSKSTATRRFQAVCRYVRNRQTNLLPQEITGRDTNNLITINCCSKSVEPIPNSSSHALSCCVINACSLKKHNALQLLATEIHNFDVDIAAVTETWLNSNVANSSLSVAGYNLVRSDRLGRKGGGLCIFVRDSLVTSPVALPTASSHSYLEDYKLHELLYLKVEKSSQIYIFILVYHPPRPKYKPDSLLTRLAYEVEYLIDIYPNAIIYLTGDFNRLNITTLISEIGLQQVVTEATRGNSVLDLFLTNRPNEVNCSVFQSCMKTDHRALLVNCFYCNPCMIPPTSRRKVAFYDLRKPNIDALAQEFNYFDWSSITDSSDVDSAYDDFLSITSRCINLRIPLKTVTMSDNTPTYITPLIKSLLRTRNKLMHRGKTTDAHSLSVKIGKLISDTRAKQLSQVTHKDIKKLWASVRSATGVNKRSSVNTATFSSEDLADYFTGIATDPLYDQALVNDIITSLSSQTHSSSAQTSPQFVHQYEVYKCLSAVKKTASGPDNTPYWLFKHFAIELTPVVTHIINLTLTTGKPPNLWKRALITPVPKIAHPKELSDFRPISVTPLLSRIVERIIVRKFLLPSLPDAPFRDQFAYRPTCSTTACLVALEYKVAQYLESVSYVRCLLVDYSKAFDTINHLILFKKLQSLKLPPNINLWICNFLTGRIQSVSCGGIMSDWKSITASIIQGSGIGPSLFIIYIKDLKPLSNYNTILKYADDTTLLVPQYSSTGLELEFAHLIHWSQENKLKVNTSKTKEIVFRRPRLSARFIPSSLPGIEQVNSAKVLGLILSHSLSPACHIGAILTQCNQRLYLLSQLKHQNLSPTAMDVIFHALILSKLTYALPAFAGHISISDINKINKFFRKAFRRGLVTQIFDINTLISKFDHQLFKSIQYPDHCLHNLLPEKRTSNHSRQLRPRGHDYALTHIQSTTFKNAFINRSLFSTI